MRVDLLSSCNGVKSVDSYASGSAKSVDCFHKPWLEKTSCIASSSSMALRMGSRKPRWGMTRQTFPWLSPTRTLALSRLFLQLFATSSFHSITTNTYRLVFTMPPRKKAKASAASTPLGDTQPKTPQDSGPSQSQDDLLNDPWADEQETQLFKSMMKWKPTGGHTAV